MFPMPAVPSQSVAKFLTVLGTSSPNSPKMMRPADLPPICISKYAFYVTVERVEASAKDILVVKDAIKSNVFIFK